jgi:hypothetical protein
MNDNLFSPLYDQLNKDPYKVLYVSVILQSFLDLFKEKQKYEASSITLERDQARAWFFSSIGVTSEDFEAICTYAGLEPHRVRSFALKVIEIGDQENVRRRINILL